jgi:excisionase family DNA binding protein
MPGAMAAMTARSITKRPRAEKVGGGQIPHSPAPDDRKACLRRRGRPRPQVPEPLRFFTVAEVAERLQVSTRTIRRWIENGELVAHHLGGTVRIAENDFTAFLAIHRDL